MWTNLGKQRLFEEFFEASSIGTEFHLQLASATPGSWGANMSSTADVGLVSSVGQTDGSGLLVPRDGTSVSRFTVSTALELSLSASRAVLITANDAFQFSGAIASAKYVLLTNDGAVPQDREIYAWWSIGESPVTVDVGNTLTINSASLQAN